MAEHGPVSALEAFNPATREWFERAFAEPTAAQAQAWPAIASGEHVLISAPTGSGKTLAAFLWGIDRLAAETSRPTGISLVYVSPLKALSYDIDRNLRVPLRGIDADLSVAVRSGDTPQRERQQMLRNPPDILITTPESLYLMLTGQAQKLFEHTRWCIVDEIHAVASTKRGAHLALTLERLAQVAQRSGGSEPQRIGLSATQNPLEEVARFMVGPSRQCRIVDAGVRKQLDLRIQVPVESMAAPGETSGAELDPLAGGTEPTLNSIWPAMYPELLALVREHNSTIIFVNARRSAERLALRLNELAAAEDEGGGRPVREIARAHHGSLAREERTVVEELLKAGELPCLVATSSLELGIDMGAVDLVIQVESPKSVARGLQRIGRAGHNVGDVSRGRIFPKFRADLLECTVVAKRMREALIETTVVPRNPLDVLAQQIVSISAAAEGAIPPANQDGAPKATPSQNKNENENQNRSHHHEARVGAGALVNEEGAVGAAGALVSEEGAVGAAGALVLEEGLVSVDALYALVTRTHTYAELTRASFENVLDMLDGRYPSSEFAELRPRIVWDRIGGTVRARPGARQLAVTNAGTIPDRGNYLVTLPDGRRVGEFDEEMVYEARPGQTFLLGASTWRIEEIGRDRVIVTPAPGMPGAVPFWKGDSVGRPSELGEAIGAFSRWAVDQDPQALEADYDLDARAARNLVEFLREQRDATRVVPSDTAIVLERFRDEIGDWRLCVLSPYGGRVHAAWALALSARIRDELELEADAIWSDDGIIVHLPDAEDLDFGRLAEMVLIDPEEVEDLVVAELSGSALFGARFRENAGRALLIPRAYPGRRTPLWQQRLKSQSLLEVAAKYGEFPIVLETFRECLRDVFDLPALVKLLTKLGRRELSLVEVETAVASPMASSLLFDYVATYMYEGDTPNAERRAAALSLDRDLLRELLGQEELRDLIDAGALAGVEADLQWLSEPRLVATRDQLHDMLRALGDLNESELAARVLPGVALEPMLETLRSERRAVQVRLGGEKRWIDATDAGLYRDALGAVPPGGLPDAFLADVSDALLQVVRRYASTHGPFTTAELHERYGVDPGAVLGALERDGDLVQGELRPGGSGREWCHREVLRRLRRASLAALRKEVEPVEDSALARFLPSWQGIDRHPPGGAGVDRLRDVLVPLQGLALPVEVWEREVLPRRTGAYSPAWIDQLCAAGEIVWIGAGALGRSGRVALYFRDDVALLGAPSARGDSGDPPEGPLHAALRERLARGAAFFTDLLVDVEFEIPASELQEALWDLVWAGEVTNDAFAPLRAPRLSVARSQAAGQRASSRRGRFSARGRGATAQVQGRWSLTAPLLMQEGDPAARRRARAELMLERYGVLTREQVLAEGVPGGFSGIYSELTQLEMIGVARRGYFVEGLGGAQFAVPGAVERLRERRSGAEQALVLSAVDPAQAYGAALPWPKREGAKSPARVAGAQVVLLGGEPILYVERGGKGLQTLVDLDDARIEQGLAALAEHVRAGRGAVRKLALEKVDGEPALSSPLSAALRAHGFQEGPRRFTLSA
ncbi:MAG TPA: DEAD/DEAH box helicase [Solirubrobacteraceae bacterium]|nr:DEAD/DEAH box helicase [Solirubrobacteraceae bacterium]